MKSEMPRGEFIALMAMLAALTAFAIDAMLPAMPEIGAELSPAEPNRAQLILTSFVFGMGLGTFFAGPLADWLGRRPVIIGGIVLYALGAALAWKLPGLDGVLAARMLMGVGASAPRVVSMAMVRDRYVGPDMARLMSFVMVVFMIVPAIAPSIGALIMGAFGWRAIFPAFLLFGLVALVWFALRQPETLHPEDRRPVRWSAIRTAVREMFALPVVRQSVMIQTLGLGTLFGTLSSVQYVFDQAYGQGAEFPMWFAVIAVASAGASMLNARLVTRMGLLRIVRGMLIGMIAMSGLMLAGLQIGLPPAAEFVLWMVWVITVFFHGGLVLGNVNAMAMQPLGHIAGIAASVITAIATIGSALLAVPVGLAFNGTAAPLAIGALIFSSLALLVAYRMRQD